MDSNNNNNTAANNHSTNDNVSSASSSSSTAAGSTLTTSTTTSSAVNNTAANNNTNTLNINSTMIPPPIPPGPPNYTTTGGEVSTKQASTTAKPPQQQQQQGPHLLNDCQQQQILEQIMQQQQQTLARHYHHQMMAAAAVNDPHHHHHLHHILQQASHRVYPQATGTSSSQQQQQQQQPQYVDIRSTTDQSSAAAAATTAYLVQTPNGSALLIPPPFLNQALVSNTTSSSLTRAPNPSAAAATAAATSTMNPYGITTIPLTHSPSINLNLASHHHLIRPESTASTNVYQTIDAAEKNGYLYPMESFYETSALTSTNSPSTLQQPLHHHNCSTRHKSTKNRQQQQQSCLQYHHQIQQQQSQTNGGQFIKLIEAACSSSSSSSSSSSNTKSNNNSTNMTGTLHSNTNNTNQTATTNSNFFVSPALSATSNRRFDNSSILERLKYRLTKSFGVSGKCCCSWKFLAIFFLILTVNFLAFTIYLSVMRFYNLNWHLKENQVASKHQLISERRLTNAILFSKIGDIVDDKIAPYDFFNTQIYLDSANYVKFNLSLNRNAQIGFYAEKNSPPTFTKFKYFENFDANTLVTRAQKINYEKRLLTGDQQDTMVNTGFVHYLEDGLWYISLYNDNKSPLKFRLKTDFYNYESKICPLNCHGKGDCVNGKCKCYPGFSGIDCSLSSCPLLCSGHGKYENGRCVCDLDWHGNECQVPIERCEVANCNGNGECINGICICYVGYRGKNCDQLGCRSENCSNNGVCIEGQCRCFQNYTGSDCNEQIQTAAFSSVAALSSTICSSHGEFDYTARRCKCESGWSGSDCSRNDNCLDKACTVCRNGFGGLFCLDRTPLRCDPRCSEHGVCMNGTCTCSPGYHGRHCDINSCPKSCSSNGQCERISNTHRYQCVCNKGWTGVACESAVELLCNDNIDNDGDGLVDCMDSECCSVDNCKLSLACTSSPEPKDRLLRKQPPSLSATFFEKMKFLIEDDSVQSFAYPSTFAESQVSIIRGQVLFKNGQPLIGVKVSILSNPTYGYTLTRYNGIFDMMVNGGGSVLLEFTRQGLKTRIVSVSTTWNQFSHIDPVRMYLLDDDDEEDGDEESDNRDSDDSTRVLRPSPCASDNSLEYHRLRPIVQTSLLGGTTTMSSPLESNLPVRPESGVLHSRVPLGDTTLSLVYTSSQSAGYQSTLFVLLTPETIPDRLRVVHLRIEIEGVLHRIKFDAVEMLRYEFAWDRRNAYEQRVYGLTWAKVRVGYEYEGGCDNSDSSKKSGGFIHWESVVVKLAGYDLGSSEIGSWNIDVHHRLNTQQGILHKGDGSTIYVKEIQKNVEIVAGRLRLKRDIDIDCTVDCEQAKFYSPHSLSVNKDGLVFVGDFNYVWMLNSTQTPKVVLELSKDQPYKYHMTNDPLKGNLFISDALNSRIISLRALDPNQSDLKSNFKLIIGDQDQRKSRQNRFIHPKSLAFDTNGAVIYYIDSNEVRSIAIGSTGPSQVVISGSRRDEKPSFECKPVQSVSEARLRWPTALAISPLDNSLYILDDGDLIYRVTPSNTVELVAGVPIGCEDDTSRFKPLNRVVDMSFAPDGDLFLLENDGQIRVVRSNRQIEVFLADNFAGFNDPVSIAVHPNRSVYVLDRGDNVLYHVKPSTLRRQSDSDDFYGGKYTVVSPDTREAFIFNRFGLHMHTMDLASGLMVYNFTYNGNALYGKLTAITDHAKTIVTVKRDFHGRAEFIQTSSGLTLKLKLNNFDMLRSLTTSNDNRSYIFNYMGNVGLLISRTEPNEKTTMYNYEKNGKVKEIIDPNQQSTNISYSINSNGLVTSMTSLGNTETWLMNSTSIQVYKNGKLDSQIDSSRLIYSSIRSLSSDDQLSLYRSSGVVSTVKAAKSSASKSGSKSKIANRKLVNKLT